MPHSWDDKWQDVRALGKGGQGITRLVTSKTAPKINGALKYLLNNQSRAARARMAREVAALESLVSLGGKVPRVLAHNTDKRDDLATELYLVMEFIEGETLKDFVERTARLTLNQAATFTLALCDTVKTAHSENILHRDIKPDNIIIRDASRCELYIIDYGLSFNAADADVTETAETFRNKFLDLPETNTPSGNRRDPRSDVTALCAVFYFMLTGHRPGHLQDGQGKMPHVRPGFSVRETLTADPRLPQVELLFNRGFAFQLQYRFQNIDEFSERVNILSQQSPQTQAVDPISTAARLSALIREHDRPTQLAELRPIADALLEQLARHINQYPKTLDRFQLTVGIDNVSAPLLPEGFDVLGNRMHVDLTVRHHPELRRSRQYAIASQLDRCVVYYCPFTATPDRPNKKDYGEWQQLAWFAFEFTDAVPVLFSEFDAWLDRSLTELTEALLTGG